MGGSGNISAGKDKVKKITVKDFIKKIPVLGDILRILVRMGKMVLVVCDEIGFLKVSHAVLKDFDMLVVTGSNQFLDNFGGPFGFPYTLLKWSLLSRMTGTRLAFVSVGAGPLTRRLSKIFIRIALSLADYVSFRDKGSFQLIESIGFHGKASVTPDLAFSLLNMPARHSGIVSHEEEPIVVGINPMPVFDRRYWPIRNDMKYRTYVLKLAILCGRLLQKNHRVFFFATQPRDMDVIDDILQKLFTPGKFMESYQEKLSIRNDQSVDELITTIDTADVVITTRFHGIVLSLLSNKPVIGICYGPKSDELLKTSDQGDFSFNIEDFYSGNLLKAVERLKEDSGDIHNRNMALHHNRLRTLNRQYDNLISLLQ